MAGRSQRGGGLPEPDARVLVELGAEAAARARGRRRASAISSALSSSLTIRRRSMGTSVSVSKPIISRSPPGSFSGSVDEHEVLDADAVGALLVIAGLVGDRSCRARARPCRRARSIAGPRARRDSCRRRGRCRDRSRGPCSQSARRAKGSRSMPRVPLGNVPRRWRCALENQREVLAHFVASAGRWRRCA